MVLDAVAVAVAELIQSLDGDLRKLGDKAGGILVGMELYPILKGKGLIKPFQGDPEMGLIDLFKGIGVYNKKYWIFPCDQIGDCEYRIGRRD